MKFSIKKSNLNQLLQKLINIINGNTRLSILNYILLKINNNQLFITAANPEIEITAQGLLEQEYPPKTIMIQGRKLFEICHNLPENANILIELKNNKICINSKYSNFYLSTISSDNFPEPKQYQQHEFNITIPQLILKNMIKLTYFAMANQDTRFYLNGIFFETSKNSIRMVATDGYRLATCETYIDTLTTSTSVIIPRKSVLEILHLLNSDQNIAKIKIHDNFICINMCNCTLTSQLINSTFPDYHNVFPKKPKYTFEIDRIILKQALKRAAILAHSKHRIINLDLTTNQLKITTHNFDQDASEEILKISYLNENIQISFNVNYLLDIINVIDSQNLRFYILNKISGVQIEGIPPCLGATYVLMPIKI